LLQHFATDVVAIGCFARPMLEFHFARDQSEFKQMTGWRRTGPEWGVMGKLSEKNTALGGDAAIGIVHVHRLARGPQRPVPIQRTLAQDSRREQISRVGGEGLLLAATQPARS
jgi:hypothetical protein